MKHIEIIYKSTAELIPYINNARTHSEKQVAQIAGSIKEFGFNNPILLDGKNGVIAGHGRLEASKLLGLEVVPCIELEHLSEAEKRAYILADNRIALNAGWDEEILSIELGRMSDEQIGLLGFDVGELRRLLDAGNTSPIETYDLDQEVEIFVNRGDVYQLGRHRLMCGDATSSEDVMKLMDGKLADMLLTDPPYGVDYEGGTAEKLTIQNDKKGFDEFIEFLKSSFVNASHYLKSGGVFYIWHADSRGFEFRAAAQMAELEVRQCLIWHKSSLVMGRQDYHWIHEPCLYGWKEGAAHLWASDRKQVTVLNFDRPSVSKIHPTMKPVPLFEYQIKNNSKGDDIVMDLFAGSGTTIIACENTGRVSYSMELDERYASSIIRRWESLTGQTAEKIT